MKISRIRVALSAAFGLSLAVVALGMATMLDHQTDPALAQSSDLRARFAAPSGTGDPARSLRTPQPQPRQQPTQLAAPAADPTEAAIVASAPAVADEPAAQPASVQAAAQPVAEGAEPQEHGDDGEHEGGDD